MAVINRAEASGYLSLDARTVAELMVANPVSIRDNATIQELVALLTDKGFGAAPVIDAAGRPVGVVSLADIVAHDRERLASSVAVPEGARREGTPAGNIDPARVRDIMTPVVLSVTSDAPAAKVVQEMVGLKVHRLFVVDRPGVLIGVITAMDVLRHLK
jgi:predicted transcriptional regulator